MAIVLDTFLCIILSGVMLFCSGFATYGCYRCFTDNIDGSKIVPEEKDLSSYRESRERYRLRLFRRRPSTASSQATIYTVHSSEVWSRQSTPRFNLSPSSSALWRGSGISNANPKMFINSSQIRGWTIHEEKEPPTEDDANENRRKSAPI